MNMCKVKLGNDSFRNFEGFGYSVCCPGPGVPCELVRLCEEKFSVVGGGDFCITLWSGGISTQNL